MAECPPSPSPGYYEYDVPYGWEEDPKDIEYREVMAEKYPEDYNEDPILKAMRLEAETEQDKASYQTPRQHAKMIKDHIVASRRLNFDRNLSKHSIESYLTEDFMSQPDEFIFDHKGEQAWMAAYKAKAQRHKKLRKLLDEPSSPVKKLSPKKIAQAYAKQTPAVKKAVAEILATPKKFGDINLDSSDDEDVPLPSSFAKAKIAQAGKKSFFADVSSPGKSPSPFKPLPAAIKKSFFAAPDLDSDSDSDLEMLGLNKIASPPKKFTVAKKSFFSSPAKLSPFKKAANAAILTSKTEFCLAVLDGQLHERQKELIKIKAGEKLYKPCPFLPNNVTAYLSQCQGSPGFSDIAVKVEELIIEAMISKLEEGKTKCNPHEVLREAQQKLRKDCQQLDAILSKIDQL